jgi:subtilisin family serine protease
MFTIPTTRGLPEYHDNLLLVKVLPSAATAPTTFAAGGLLGAPGLSALNLLERAGSIKRVVPLGPAPGPATFGALATLAASVQGEGPTLLTGVNLIELDAETDSLPVRLALANDPHVEFASRVPVRYLLARARGATPAAVPPATGILWNLKKIKWKEALAGGLGKAEEIHVAVLDTGIDPGHPDLPGNDINYVFSYPPAGPVTSNQDLVGHGTHVAGTIRALINNNLGINGICACKLSAYKIFTDETVFIPPPWGNYFAFVVDPILYRSALAACVDAGVQVINLSIGGPGTPDEVEKALFQALIDNNVGIVAAMGNENSSQKSYPAAIPGVIAVGATSINDARASFSNYGNHIALCAPGVGIWSTLPTYAGQTGFFPAPGASPPTPGQPMTRETDYDSWDGTSMATPHVTAAAALALAKQGNMTSANLKSHLMKAVDRVPGMQGQNFTTFYGAGRLNLLKL